jgi:hypothetical protein
MANSTNDIDVAGEIGGSGMVGAFRQEGPLQGSCGSVWRSSPREVLAATGAESGAPSFIAAAGSEVGVCASQSPHEANDELARPVSTAAQIDAHNTSMQERKATASNALNHEMAEKTARTVGHCTQ